MLDHSISENIYQALTNTDDLWSDIEATYHILLGEHFDFNLRGRKDNRGGQKGALDLFILPLVARKLIADTYLPERRDSDIANCLAWMIAVPIEAMRFSTAFVLTIFLVPLITLIYLVKLCINPIREEEPDYSVLERGLIPQNETEGKMEQDDYYDVHPHAQSSYYYIRTT